MNKDIKYIEPVTDTTALQLCKYIRRDDAAMVDHILEYTFGNYLEKVSSSKINNIYVDCDKSIKNYHPQLNIRSDELDKACLLLSEKLIELNHPQKNLICAVLNLSIKEIQNMVTNEEQYEYRYQSKSVLWINQNNDLYKLLKEVMSKLDNDSCLVELNYELG
jgi:hypothetical protein